MSNAASRIGAWPAGLFLALIGGALGIQVRAAETTGLPNIVFMLADDQGWNGLSVAMAPDVPGSRSDLFQTPHLERFAAQGMRFSNAYAPAPVCSPSRSRPLASVRRS